MGKPKKILKATKRGGVRSKNNRNKKKIKNEKFSILGTNAAGLKAKKDSLVENIRLFDRPSIITIQETKFRKIGNFKIENYEIFEKIRTEGYGGGLLTAVDKSLEPVLIEAANEDTEILVVQVKIGGSYIRIINGYGPQEDDLSVKRFDFWQSIEQEIISAKNSQCMVLIQCDANAKLGKELISQDPHKISENGQLLKALIEREKLALLNSSNLCEGAITRNRMAGKNEEKSIIDYILVCENLSDYLEQMLIDEKRLFPLTKYATTKGVKKLVKSDHNILYAQFSLTYRSVNWKKSRKEVFNLKNPDCQAKFNEVTSNSQKLKQCLIKANTIEEESNKFFKNLDDILHQCFRKIRVGKKSENQEINKLLAEKSKLKLSLGQNLSQSDKSDIENKIEQIENKMLTLSSERNVQIVEDHLKLLGNSDNKLSQNGMWKLKNKLWPKERDPPMAKFDGKGKLISCPVTLKKLYLEHYVQRLAHRLIKESYQENYQKKMALWQIRFSLLRSYKSADWRTKELRNTIKSLKNNKTRDPSGLLVELLKPPVIGQDLEQAILRLVNGIKSEYFIPQNVQMSNITTIFKSSGSRHDLESDRGIFSLSIWRKLIDKMIYLEKYPLIDGNMTDSNVGARKKKNIKNHLFIIYGIINSVVKGESESVDIQIYDLVKAFDVLWLEDSMNDAWDTLPHSARDDRLGLVYQMSRSNLVAINTAVGQTDRVNITDITAQGGTWGPLLCSNSIDTVGRWSESSGQYYKYKKMAKVLPLAMVDDLLAVRRCGFDSVETNITINTMIELKKLEFHIPKPKKKSKCHYLHIGRPSHVCPGMKVHGHKAEKVSEAVYLGDILREDGKNTSNIKSRVKKGLGIVARIMDILKTISFGKKYFEIARTLREAELINGILTNAEVWYGLKKSEIEELEKVDKLLLRRILGAPDSSSIESLYLELGVVPIRVIIKARRVTYLHYLTKLDKNQMLSKVFETQWKYPVRDDWTLQVQEDLKDLNIGMSLKEIEEKSEYSFKKHVKIKSKEYALEYLLNLKSKHSKMENLDYIELKLQKYFTDDKITVQEARNLFRYRIRVAKYRENMKNNFELSFACPLCHVHPDTQQNSFVCEIIQSRMKVKGSYTDIFMDDIPVETVKTLMQITELRDSYENQ